MKNLLIGAALLAPLGWLGGAARADVKLPALFGDNMILQRDKNVAIWGTADVGEAVTVQLGEGNIARGLTDSNGRWLVRLAPHSAATGLTLKVTGNNALVFQNVAVGEVWICSGQSNMGFQLAQVTNAEAEIAGANFPNLRLFTVGPNPTLEPQSDLKGKWDVSTPETARRFSAVAFLFGRELHQKLGVPVGVVNSSWGGTVAEAWTSREALEAVTDLKSMVENQDALIANYPAELEKYQKETFPAWEIAAQAAKDAGQKAPAKPGEPRLPTNQNNPSNLFNGMIAPLIPYGIKGAIWYQGESNAGRAVQYRALFPTLIQDWRSRFDQGDFPFFWVQLANYQAVQTTPVQDHGWPMLREAQSRTLALPRTGQALAIDLADKDKPQDIHPHNKQDVAHRLALLALNREYNQKVIDSGPVFELMSIQGNQARLNFQNADGLKATGDKLQGFAIAGADNVWKWADATIENNQVVLSNPEVQTPVAVRYGWAVNPIGNLYNGANLPATPFRTDVDAEK